MNSVGIIEALLQSARTMYPDTYAFYILDQIMNNPSEEGRRLWQRVLDYLHSEREKMNTYNQLADVHKHVKPYRNTNEYPFINRKHRHKYFIPREVNGKIEYDIYYGNYYTTKTLSDDEYNLLSEDDKVNCSKYENDNKWHLLLQTKNKVATIRDDNTIEFTKNTGNLHQGERGYLFKIFGGYILSNVRQGGVVWYKYINGERRTVPLFEGLRVNIDTLEAHESSKYEIITRVVNRGSSSEMLKEYENVFKLAETVYKVMDRETYIMQARQILLEHNIDAEHSYFYSGHVQELLEQKISMIADPIAYFLLRPMLASYHVRNAVSSGRFSSWFVSEPIDLYVQTKRDIVRDLYKQHNTFKSQIIPCTEYRIPNSHWDIEVMQNGKLVEQYGG
jgi:hypothetical protein